MLKTLLTICSVLSIASMLVAQELNTGDKRYITVTGSAEVNVQPDEIELEIVLKEYGDEFTKIRLDKIEKDFFEVLKKNKIPMEKVNFNNSNYYWYYYWRYRYESYKERRYNVKLDKSTDFLALIKDLDNKGVHTLSIASTTNAKLQELRKDIKIQAVKAAKDKATYLLESIDEKLGRVIAIEELPENSGYYWGGSQSISNVSMHIDRTEEDIDNIATIKLRYDIKAKFEIME